MLITIKISSCTKSIVYCASRGYCGISTCIVVRSIRISTSKHRCYTWTIIIANSRIIVDCCWVHTACIITTRTIIKNSYRRIIICCLVSTTVVCVTASITCQKPRPKIVYCSNHSCFLIICKNIHTSIVCIVHVVHKHITSCSITVTIWIWRKIRTPIIWTRVFRCVTAKIITTITVPPNMSQIKPMSYFMS